MVSTPRVGICSEELHSSCPKPEISDTRDYSYDEMVEDQLKQYDSNEFEFIMSPVETDF